MNRYFIAVWDGVASELKQFEIMAPDKEQAIRKMIKTKEFISLDTEIMKAYNTDCGEYSVNELIGFLKDWEIEVNILQA
jgi:hypothetical protein